MLTDTQTKLLTRTLERIEQHPETHDQQRWYHEPRFGADSMGLRGSSLLSTLMPGSLPALVSGPPIVDTHQMHECGATACFAGHTLLAAAELGVPITRNGPISVVAGDLLGMPPAIRNTAFSPESTESQVRTFIDDTLERGAW